MKHQNIVIALIAAAAAFSFSSCSGKQTEKTEKISETKTAAVTEAQTADSLPTDEFSEIPEEAACELNYVTEISGELFPDASGKKMYGYRGVEEIETESGTRTCYIFDFYTYKSKAYTKIAQIAKASDSSDIYIKNEETDGFELWESPQREIDWHDQVTAALAVYMQNPDELSNSPDE
jgi:hypothetical protein